MKKIKFTPIRSLVAAVILWIVSIYIPITPITVIIFFAVIVAAGIQGAVVIETKGSVETDGSKKSISWGLTDYIGTALLLLVVYAIFRGIDPVELIKLIVPLFTGRQ